MAKKIDFKKVVMNAVTIAGTGAAAQILKEAVLPENPEMMDYIMIGTGLVIPEVVKSPEMNTIGNSMLAIGAYRMADRLELAGKLGVNTTGLPATSGLPSQHSIASGWKPKYRESEKKNQKAEKKVMNPGTVQ